MPEVANGIHHGATVKSTHTVLRFGGQTAANTFYDDFTVP